MATKKITELNTLTGAGVANGDLLPIVDIGTPNETKAITADQLAQMPQLSSRYVSKSADDEYRWISAGEMAPVLGSPVLGTIAGNYYTTGGMLYDASADEGATFNLMLPSHWTTYKIELWWANTAASSGNVNWLMRLKYAGDNEDPDGGDNESNIVVAAPASQRTVEVTQLAASVTNNDAKVAFGVLFRVGSNGADTLANDAGVYGIMLTRLS